MERDWADGTTRFLQMEQSGEAIDRQGAVRYSAPLMCRVSPPTRSGSPQP